MAENLPKDMQSLQINGTSTVSVEQTSSTANHEDWGFPLQDLYKMALHFYKGQDGKGLHPSYKDKLKMVALTKQAAHGKYTPDASPAVGFLDVVGNDRKQMWMSLGDMSKDTAMAEFVKNLDSLCPQFKPHVQAQKAEREEQERKRKEEEEQKRQEEEEKQRKLLEDEAERQLQFEKQRQLEQEKQIRAALNQQTAQQFKQYAEQQCPGNIKQQEELIAQLQEQHFQQYMQQVYQQQLLHQQQQYQQLQAMQAAQKAGQTETPPTNGQVQPTTNQTPPTNYPTAVQNGPVAPPEKKESSENESEDAKDVEEALANVHLPKIEAAEMWLTKEINEFKEGMKKKDELPPIAAASMWTRKDVKEFKESLKKDKDSVIKVGSGETVTVRVPTHEDGSCLFWEFATDYYDIGFGVFFEWTIAPSNTVSVHVSESSDEEDIEEEETKANDVEKGGDKRDDRPPVDEIIPVYRRDCHEEVYCGSHAYPGRGVYLLKFDNSYSLWRSKTLYYRVYYSR